MKKNSILVFPGGYECGIEIIESLKDKKDLKIFSANSLKRDVANFLDIKNFKLPNIGNKNFLSKLNKLLLKNRIKYIYPSHPEIINFFNFNRKKIKAFVLLGTTKTLNILEYKKKYLKLFNKETFYIKQYSDLENVDRYPIILKLNKGYGSKNLIKINSKIESYIYKNKNLTKYIIQDFIPGKEYTVECLSNHKGKLVYVNARERFKIRMGTSFYSFDANRKIQKESEKISKIISKKIKMIGVWFFQFKLDKKKQIKLLEIENRVGGTMSFSRAKGVNLAYLNFLILNNKKIKISENTQNVELTKKLLPVIKYKNLKYKNLYIDLDDCLISPENKVNLKVIKFLYRAINENKKIILLSKSNKKNKQLYLKKFKIFEIFDQIIWLKENDKKYKYIKKNSIFIDDSFSQREEVFKKLGVQTLDPEMIFN